MKTSTNKKIAILIFAIVAIILFIFFGTVYLNSISHKNDNAQNSKINEGSFEYNKDGTVKLGLGMIANGFYDANTNKLIDSGSLYIPVNGKIQGNIIFQQNISEKRNYLLIIMIDYKQHDFSVKGKTYSTFPFSLKGEDKICINLEITDLYSDAYEFSYFIIPEPELTELSIDDSKNWDRLLMTGNLYPWRLLLSNTSKSILPIEYDNSYIKMHSETKFNILLAKSYKQAAVMPSCKSMEDAYLILGNNSTNDIEYAIIAFLKWNQIPIYDKNIILYVKIPAQSNIYYRIKIPSVKENTPYQIFAIPQPFSKNIQDVMPPAVCTLRTIIKP